MYKRYALYHTPVGPLAAFGARWLGWDIAQGCSGAPFDPGPDQEPFPDLERITRKPRKYGMHGTIKAPFQLASATDAETLMNAVSAFAAETAPVYVEGLDLARIGRFLALVPRGDQTALADLAARTVRAFDAFAAPLTEAELARRRKARLTPTQDRHLVNWGYPYVMDEFRFHITLSGSLDGDTCAHVRSRLEPLVAPLIPQPYPIDSLTLVGEDEAGFFHEIHRYTLSG